MYLLAICILLHTYAPLLHNVLCVWYDDLPPSDCARSVVIPIGAYIRHDSLYVCRKWRGGNLLINCWLLIRSIIINLRHLIYSVDHADGCWHSVMYVSTRQLHFWTNAQKSYIAYRVEQGDSSNNNAKRSVSKAYCRDENHKKRAGQ